MKIGACQTPDFRECVEESLDYLEARTREAEQDGIDLLLFPEGYLQGYLIQETLARKSAYNLRSSEFARILLSLRDLRPVIVVGLIEECEGKIFNSAVVIEGGRLIGDYRKTHLLPGESVFTHGDDYPLFEAQGLRFGINICYDMQFPEAAAAVKAAGADVILCPSNNMMRREKAEKWKHRHHEMRVERARETGLWIVSADVTGERDGRIGYGPTSVISPDGRVVRQIPLLSEGIVQIEMPIVADK